MCAEMPLLPKPVKWLTAPSRDRNIFWNANVVNLIVLAAPVRILRLRKSRDTCHMSHTPMFKCHRQTFILWHEQNTHIDTNCTRRVASLSIFTIGFKLLVPSCHRTPRKCTSKYSSFSLPNFSFVVSSLFSPLRFHLSSLSPTPPSVDFVYSQICFLRARFSRAISELQFMGLIQRTNKKTDHVEKLLYL